MVASVFVQIWKTRQIIFQSFRPVINNYPQESALFRLSEANLLLWILIAGGGNSRMF
jgi:hypothetical protein